jgi:hypothetical protein
MEQRSSTNQRTEEIPVELERLLLRLRVELVEVFEAQCNFRVTINGSAGRTGKIEVTKFVSF